MGFMDKAKAFFKSEASDLKDGMDSMKDKMDAELTKREQELAASPSERMDMMQEEIAQTDARFDDLSEQVQQKKSAVDSTAEVAQAAAPAPLTTADLPTVAELQEQEAAKADQVETPATETAVTTAAASPSVPVIPARPIGTKNRSSLLEKSDVPANDKLDEALTWVTAELVVEGMPEYGQFDHAVVVNPPDGTNTSDSGLQVVVDAVAKHPLVKEGKYEGGRLLYFYATGLAPEDLQLLTASVLAANA